MAFPPSQVDLNGTALMISPPYDLLDINLLYIGTNHFCLTSDTRKATLSIFSSPVPITYNYKCIF
jgi:hypothetical protein